MRSRPKSARSSSSAFQQSFEKKQMYKRNKRYINLDKMNSNDLSHSILRRKPLNTEDERLSHKFHSSFMNSTAQLTERLGKQINKYKSRVSFSARGTRSELMVKEESLEKQNFQQQSYRSFGENARSFSIEKMTSREYHDKLRNKPCSDQRQFNNFQSFSPNTPLASDFKSMKGKVLDNTIKHINDIQYDTQQLYQRYYYSNSSTYCKVNYPAQKRSIKGRKFFESKRPQNIPATELDLQKVDQGMKIASNYKGSNINQSGIAQFYRGSHKGLPSQTDMRQMNELTNHWVDIEGKIPKKKLDYGTRKMKQDMVNGRKQKIMNKKISENKREQMCDVKFFNYLNN